MKKLNFTLCALISFLIPYFSYAQINVGIESSPNFRDLGGIEVSDGYILKEGLMYRSGSFTNLSGSDAVKFKNTGLNTVIDFRSDFEIEREPDFIPEDMGINWIHAPIGSMDQSSMGEFMKVLMKDDFTAEDVDNLMIEANKGFVASIQDFKPLFDQALEEGNVILFHCSAGKDRTGLASSLFLSALGADWDTIIKDFLRSNEAVEKTDLSKLSMYGIPEERGKVLMGVKSTYLESAWEEIHKNYGSVDNLLEKEFGIGASEKERLRQLYLTRN
jgi:protein-tyrosine phosphatase